MNSPLVRVVNTRNNQVIVSDLHEAKSLWQRSAGLMFRASLPDAQGIVFRPGRGMHSHFMRFPIDLIYLDGQGTVQSIRAHMAPWRFDLRYADAVIEANAGAAYRADLRIGDRVRLESWEQLSVAP